MLAEKRRKIERLTANIRQAETEVDNIVYGLFDLTADEIALIEEGK